MSTEAGPIPEAPTSPSEPTPPAAEPTPPSAAERDETDRLDPLGDRVRLTSGTTIKVLPLKMRQLFRLLRIVTRGGAGYIPMLREAMTGMTDDENGGADAFGAQLLAVMVIALPEAEDEAVEFVLSVSEPVDLSGGSDRRAKAADDAARDALRAELFNPELDDIVTIVEKVIQNERDDMVALGKRLGQTFRTAAKVDPQMRSAASATAG